MIPVYRVDTCICIPGNYLLSIWGFQCFFFYFNHWIFLTLISLTNIREVIVKTYSLLTFYSMVIFVWFSVQI